MNEEQFRSAIAAEARTWLGTPYHAGEGAVKGVGVNCAQLLYWVARNSGAIAPDAPLPRWYTPQLATHSKEERLIAYIESYGAVEIREAAVKTADIVVYKTGQAHGHAAIVLDWPTILHSLKPRGCQIGGIADGQLGKYSRRYFTLWKG